MGEHEFLRGKCLACGFESVRDGVAYPPPYPGCPGELGHVWSAGKCRECGYEPPSETELQFSGGMPGCPAERLEPEPPLLPCQSVWVMFEWPMSNHSQELIDIVESVSDVATQMGARVTKGLR